jgi:ABC-type nitrate/sulfonate/bicarbonate transport system permease component
MNHNKINLFLSIAITLGFWELIGVFVFDPQLIPPFSSVFITFWKMLLNLEIFGHLLISLKRLLIGYAAGSIVGIVLGCAIGRVKIVSEVLNPFIKLFNSIPAIAMIPLGILWFGVGELARYFLLMYIAGVTVTLNSAEGVRAVPPIHLRVAKCLGTNKLKIFLKVIIPSSFPYILTGLRTALGLSIMVLVAAEMIGAKSGVGYLIIESRYFFNIKRMFVGIITLGTLSIVIDRIFKWFVSKKLPRFDVEKRI